MRNLWEPITIEKVTNEGRSALATTAGHGTKAVVLVHGICDSVYRFVTQEECAARKIELPDYRNPMPRFDPATFPDAGLRPFPSLLTCEGLLTRLAREGFGAIAYSYQELRTPVADLADAIERLHRVVVAALERYHVSQVSLVGHSRGGLIARHAMLSDSPFLTAAEFRTLVERVITLGTPHLGSRLAEAIEALRRSFEPIERLRARLAAVFPQMAQEQPRIIEFFRQFTTRLGQLSPTAADIQALQQAPPILLPRGWYALAGTVPVYFRCRIPAVGLVQWPPALSLPELTEGKGDMAVAVASAFGIPGLDPDRRLAVPTNHFLLAFDRRVQDAIVTWLDA